MTFNRVSTPAKKMVQLKVNGKDTWFYTNDACKAKASTFTPGAEVSIVSKKFEGKTLGYITSIDLVGVSEEVVSDERFCEVCGSPLDASTPPYFKKCKTCYSGGSKTPKKPTTTKTGKYSDNYVDGMRVGNITNATASIVGSMLVALQGQVDVNNILDITKGYIVEVTKSVQQLQQSV